MRIARTTQKTTSTIYTHSNNNCVPLRFTVRGKEEQMNEVLVLVQCFHV